jgi:hypothetical protein
MTLLLKSNRRNIGLAVAVIAVLAVTSAASAGEKRLQRADLDAAKVKGLTLGGSLRRCSDRVAEGETAVRSGGRVGGLHG